MMTTMAALLGTLPIALGFGAGAESRRPLGLAVVGGLLFSQTLTLYVTPVVYLYMDSLQRRLAKCIYSRLGRRRSPMNKEKPSRFRTILGTSRFRLFAIIAVAIVVLGIALFFVFRGGGNEVAYRTDPVTRGDVQQSVTATGT